MKLVMQGPLAQIGAISTVACMGIFFPLNALFCIRNSEGVLPNFGLDVLHHHFSSRNTDVGSFTVTIYSVADLSLLCTAVSSLRTYLPWARRCLKQRITLVALSLLTSLLLNTLFDPPSKPKTS